MKTFADVLKKFRSKKRSGPTWIYARIVAEISNGNAQAEQIARATGAEIKNIQNRLSELREAGILEVHSLARNCDAIGRSRIEWRIAA